MVDCCQNKEDTLTECIKYGSIYLSLEDKFFNATDVLTWLVDKKPTLENLIAYSAVNGYIPPNDQYMDDHKHFLTKNPAYATYALLAGLDVDIPPTNESEDDTKDDLEDDTKDDLEDESEDETKDDLEEDSSEPKDLLTHIIENLEDNTVPADIANLIFSKRGTEKLILENILTFLKCRFFTHFRLDSISLNKYLVNADWTFKFRYNSDLINILLDRMEYLDEVAPNYLRYIALSNYKVVVQKLYDEKLLIKLDKSRAQTFNKFFPGILSESLIGKDNLTFKISLLGNDIAGYILGFPIQNYVPSESQIFDVLDIFSTIGKEKYAEKIKNFNQEIQPLKHPFIETTPTYANETDVLMEDISSYPPFDIVSYQEGNYIYRFTRVEFVDILEKKKNPWTGCDIPQCVLSTMQARIDIASKMNLPSSMTTIELLEKFESGDFFQKEIKDEPQANNIPISNELISGLYTWSILDQLLSLNMQLP